MERLHFTTSGHGRHNEGGRPNNGWEVWHRRRTTASLSRRHTGSERRTRARHKVNSIRKIYYFYNSQISLNKRSSFSTRPSLQFFSIYVNHPARVRGYRGKNSGCADGGSTRLLAIYYYYLLLYFFFLLWAIHWCDGFLGPRDIILISEVFEL